MNSSHNHSSFAETDSALILAELDRLLADRRFSGARQMSAFLRYIVTETLKGNGSRIKAYTVGVDALGKPDDFDAQADPSVRVLALRLRRTLAAAYEERQECHARILLRVGTYVPEFFKPEAFAEPEIRQVLQSPDHASINDAAVILRNDDSSEDRRLNAERGAANLNIGRQLHCHRQASADGIHLDTAGFDLSRHERRSKNAVAFVAVDTTRPDLRVHLFAAIVVLALWQIIDAPVNASVESVRFPDAPLYSQSTTANVQEIANVFAPNLD